MVTGKSLNCYQKPTRAAIRSYASRHNWRSHAKSNATKRLSHTPKDEQPEQTLAEMYWVSEAVGLGLLDPFYTSPSQLDAATVSRMFEHLQSQSRLSPQSRRGALAMICQRGGLENINLEGVAAVITCTEVIVATENRPNPNWSLDLC
ncbi:hypothetical protein BO86DRAFT_380400 [Aspergillus japonicus CBS 114.51]|uniref:Uncharacterized protein n=1 Tax=Aspergillus japonicus CBS 114.51 TaxID=1448312 RepID=A0A8T8WXA0_ASPJA|nr:hypothetical protein BO86DRAFT_380400 [Aspergillus japonicus CBS 114.51]RAH80496.1 hypothetical protein BO86DRAFT_380400 [Aspergillus japonicus CBS 114.51]